MGCVCDTSTAGCDACEGAACVTDAPNASRIKPETLLTERAAIHKFWAGALVWLAVFACIAYCVGHC